jgi:hypothetical protein
LNFFISNRIKPLNNPFNRKSEPVKTDIHFTGGLGLIFWLCNFIWMTTLDSNPPKSAQCPPLYLMGILILIRKSIVDSFGGTLHNRITKIRVKSSIYIKCSIVYEIF